MDKKPLNSATLLITAGLTGMLAFGLHPGFLIVSAVLFVAYFIQLAVWALK